MVGSRAINLQSSNQGNKKGSPWVALKCINNGKTLEYFDSSGFSHPNEIMRRTVGDILHSNKEIQ